MIFVEDICSRLAILYFPTTQLNDIKKTGELPHCLTTTKTSCLYYFSLIAFHLK